MNTSSAFLALPLEIRQQIYEFCLPKNLRFDVLFDLYDQNRPRGWVPPPWRNSYMGNRNAFAKDGSEGKYEPSGVADEDEEVIEYELSRRSVPELDDYCYMCKGYRRGVPSCRRSALPGILLVCRQMTEEVETMLYGGNCFRVDVHGLGGTDLAKKFSTKRREKMRSMIVVLRPMGVSYEPAFRIDPEIWDSALRNLTTLAIVAEQPEPPSPYSWPHLEWDDVFERWAAWLTPILEYVNRTLPGTARVVVDANEEKQTVQIVEKVMPGRYSFQQLRMADLIFQRGGFSVESGYWDDDGPTSCKDIINDCDYDCYYSD
ncbi:hypothetical protein LA080_001453 [Diaporthe eres]|nr:hypothetical protein LA080_001453 [Diaporthe eres]